MAPPVLTANSPVAGSISWSPFRLAYRGQTYSIPAGSTSSKYTWWPYNGGAGGALQFSATLPVLTTDDDLLFLNKAGIPVSVPTAQGLDGSLIVSGSILADAIGANQINASHIQAGSITTPALAAGAVTASTIAAGAVTAGSLDAAAITGKTITGGTITGTAIVGGSVTGTTVQTGSSGQRIVLDATATDILFYSGDVAEHGPGYLFSDVSGTGTSRYGRLILTPLSLANPSNVYSVSYNPGLDMRSPNAGNTVDSAVTLSADSITLNGSVGTSVGGLVQALTDTHGWFMSDATGHSWNGRFSSGNAAYWVKASVAQGAYASVTYSFGTMHSTPIIICTPSNGGHPNSFSVSFVSTTGFVFYADTFNPGGSLFIVYYLAAAI